MDYLVYAALGASVCLNVFLSLHKHKNQPSLTMDAKRLLSEITSGPAVVKIEVLDASQLFLRSPRG